MNPLIKLGAAAGALTAILALWATLGGPIPAWSGDIRRLDRQQAEVAVETYSTKMRSLLVIAPPQNTPAHQVWQEELNRARDQLKRAEERKILMGQ